MTQAYDAPHGSTVRSELADADSAPTQDRPPPSDLPLAVSTAALVLAMHLGPAVAVATIAIVAAIAAVTVAATAPTGAATVAAGMPERRRAAMPARRSFGRWWAIGTAGLVIAGAFHADRAWQDVRTPDRLGPYAGWARLATDPDRRGPAIGQATHVVLEIEGERFVTWIRGRGAQHRIAPLLRGETIEVVGERRPLGGRHPDRVRVRHVVGSFTVTDLGAAGPAAPLDQAANRVRRRITEAAYAAMPAERAALFTGLVIGDDTRQPADMEAEFRGSGLSHLTAVSGQNISFVLAVAGFALRRMRPGWRWVATLAIIGWFVVLTRVEPSVLRAGTMAAWAATGFALGRERRTLRMLLLSVVVLVFVDPLIAWSVGFVLSVGATAGVVVLGPRLRPLIGGPPWLAEPLAVTLGAQAGVVVPSLAVFGTMAPLGVPANLLAVPVAGAVMLGGLPLAMVAPLLAHPLDDIVLAPVEAGVAWVHAVAAGAARLEPHGAIEVAVWVVQGIIIGALVWRGWRRRGAAVERWTTT